MAYGQIEKTNINLIPDTINPTPDYYCTWQTQLYVCCDGKPVEQNRIMSENSLFNENKPYGWAYFYEEAKKDLFIVMDYGWDVPLDDNSDYYGCLYLSEDKFPGFANKENKLKLLADKITKLGWKGLGGWVCAQESPLYLDGKTVEEYWIERLKIADEAGFRYWKVDWGDKGGSFEFRRMLTELGRKYAKNLVIEHAAVKELIPCSDVFRTYDVPAIMSIPMTFEKLVEYSGTPDATGENMGLINCEDEVYIAAAGGYAMGVMRHPYEGDFTNGKADMSFPKVHRDLKTKMYEVIRATRWHRIAPAFNGGSFIVSNETLSDSWRFVKTEEELEAWWFDNAKISEFFKDGVLTKFAPSAIARNTELPKISPSKEGEVPYIIVSHNPNNTYSVATLGRTKDRKYYIPKCDVSVNIKNSDTIGIFGEYESLTLEATLNFNRVLMQDIAGDTAFDATKEIKKDGNKIVIPGELISKIGRSAQPGNDTSEPGVMLKLLV